MHRMSPLDARGASALRIRCDDPRDRFAGAQAALAMAQATGLARTRCVAAALCAAELASNAARHAHGGELSIRALSDRRGVEIVCEDRGPGMCEPELAMTDGWSRGRALLPHEHRRDGLGSGLGAVRRMATGFTVGSRDGGGAVVTVRIED
jgi:serine/threonine-protein kinase RsbT